MRDSADTVTVPALITTPAPAHTPLTIPVRFFPWHSTVVLLPVTMNAPDTSTVEPPAMDSVAPSCTVSEPST